MDSGAPPVLVDHHEACSGGTFAIYRTRIILNCLGYRTWDGDYEILRNRNAMRPVLAHTTPPFNLSDVPLTMVRNATAWNETMLARLGATNVRFCFERPRSPLSEHALLEDER